MNASCRFSSTKHTTIPSERVLLPNSHLCPSKIISPFFLSETKREGQDLHFKPSSTLLPPKPKDSFAILRIKNCKLSHPFATLSSFAEAEGEEEQKGEILLNGHHQNANAKPKTGSGDEKENDDLPGIAQAFHVSSSTASAISICMALAALTFPFFMTSLGQAVPLKTKLLSYATLLLGFYMAWNIGANDVANAMGTSVGSGALTLRQAVLTAAVLEFSGALLMGTHVTSTMQKGILVADVFQGKDSLLFAGLLSSLAAAGTWLQVTTLVDSTSASKEEGESLFLDDLEIVNKNGEAFVTECFC